MAIGSNPEIGIIFDTIKKNFDWAAWRKHVRDDLMGGYGNIGYPPQYQPKPTKPLSAEPKTIRLCPSCSRIIET
jgi:hypothetical protein